MKIEIELDENCAETKVIILANKMTEEISNVMQILSNTNVIELIGFNHNTATFLNPADILRIYASNGKVFAVTDNEEYVLRLRLYEAEEKLKDKGFVRISNSEIINSKKAKKFDLNITGTICVTLSNKTTSYVSRRYVTKIKKALGI
ncbi:MAG: LytTR family transcriptional regulator [Anaeroplasmataceae bacterium]|nr:LytTR family transcriptional regulator [Anaeroplasmataceae bacterium]